MKPYDSAQSLSREMRIAYIQSRQPHSVHHTLGIKITSYDPVTVEVAIDKRLHQIMGIVHGGVHVLLAESAASLMSAMEVDLTRYVVSGQTIQANHLRPVHEGSLKALPRLVHAGRTSRIYDVDVVDDKGRVVSISRCTVAVRPWPDDRSEVPRPG